MAYIHNTNSTARLCRILDFSFGAFALNKNKASIPLPSQAHSQTVELTREKESMEIGFYL